MKAKKIVVENFYNTMVEWWKGHNFPVIPIEFMSDEVIVIFTEDLIPMYCTSVYLTNSGVCWLGFPISNPELSKEEKEGGLEYLLEVVSLYAKTQGYEYIFTTSPIKYLCDKFEAAGFLLGDEQVNHYTKKL